MKVLLLDIENKQAEKLDPILSWAGMELIRLEPVDIDLYQSIRSLNPEIILVDTNSPHRDTLEHLAQLKPDSPQTVFTLDGDHSEGINRLAAEVGLSLYAINDVRASLLQALIDITISYFHSIDRLRMEVQAMKPAVEQRHYVNKALIYIMDTYDLAEDQAKDLLNKNASRQQRSVTELAQQLLETGSFV